MPWIVITMCLFFGWATSQSFTWYSLPTAQDPAFRVKQASVFVNNTLYVNGGLVGANPTSETVAFNTSSATWSTITSTAGTPPSSRYSHTMVYANGHLITHGGISQIGTMQDTSAIRLAPCTDAFLILPRRFLTSPVGTSWCVTLKGVVDLVIGDSDGYGWNSYLPAAAVHAGILALGETGAVTVTLVASTGKYASVRRNGITSSPLSDPTMLPAVRLTAQGLTNTVTDLFSDGYGSYSPEVSLHFMTTGSVTQTLEGGEKVITPKLATVGDLYGPTFPAPECSDMDTSASVAPGSSNFCFFNASSFNSTLPTLKLQYKRKYAITNVQILQRMGFENWSRPMKVYAGNTLCGTLDSSNTLLSVYCGVSSDTVLVTLPGYNRVLSFAEVRAFTSDSDIMMLGAQNVTLSGGESSKGCIDGLLTTICEAGFQVSPWIQVDLGSIYRLSSISLFIAAPLYYTEVWVGTENLFYQQQNSTYSLCASGNFTDATGWISFSCVAWGRFLYVVLPYGNRGLRLWDAEIYGVSDEGSTARVYSLQTPLGSAIAHSGFMSPGDTGCVRVSLTSLASFTSVTNVEGWRSSAASGGLGYFISPAGLSSCRQVNGSSLVSVAGHSAVVYNGVMYVFGGFANQPMTMRDTSIYALDLTSWAWSTMSIGSAPAARAFHGSVVFNDAMYVYGGTDVSTLACFTDFYRFDFRTQTWSGDLCSGKGCTPRHGFVPVVVDSKMYIWGGVACDAEINYLHSISLKDFTFRELTYFQANQPLPMSFYAGGVVDTRKISSACPASTVFWAMRSSMLYMTFPRQDSTFQNVSVRFDGGFAGLTRNLIVTAIPAECGSGIRFGGKLAITLPSAFFTGFADDSWVVNISRTQSCSTGTCLAVSGIDNIQSNGSQTIVIETGVNLLVNGGGEHTFDDKPSWKSPYWTRLTPSNPRGDVLTAKYGWGWLATNVTDGLSRTWQDVDISSYPSQSIFVARGFTAFPGNDPNKAYVDIQFLSTPCGCSSCTIVNSTQLTSSIGSGWQPFQSVVTAPRGAVCVRFILVSNSSLAFFDDIFFGLPSSMRDIDYGNTAFITLAGMKVPRSCQTSASWLVGVKSLVFYEGDGLGVDSGSSLTAGIDCTDLCHSCAQRVIGGSVFYECNWVSKSGKVMQFTLADTDVQPKSSACQRCDKNLMCQGSL